MHSNGAKKRRNSADKERLDKLDKYADKMSWDECADAPTPCHSCRSLEELKRALTAADEFIIDVSGAISAAFDEVQLLEQEQSKARQTKRGNKLDNS